MPEFDQQLDTAQSELTKLAEGKQVGPMKVAEDIFKGGGLVDTFQGLTQQLNLESSPAALKHFETGESEVAAILMQMAAAGKYLEENPDAEDLPDNLRPAKKAPPRVIPGQEGKEKRPIESATNASGDINAMAFSVRTKIKEYQDSLKPMGEIIKKAKEAYPNIEKAIMKEPEFDAGNISPRDYMQILDNAIFGTDGADGLCGVRKLVENGHGLPANFLAEMEKSYSRKTLDYYITKKTHVAQEDLILTSPIKLEKEGEPGTFVEEGLAKYVEMKKPAKPDGEWEIVFTEAGNKLPPETRLKIIEALASVKVGIDEQVEQATCPKVTENFWKGQILLEDGKFEEAKKALTQFQDQDVKSDKFQNNPKLKAKEQDYLSRTETMLKQIEDVTGANKDFFEGQKLAQSGDIYGAKKLLKKYLEEAEQRKKDNPDVKDFSGTAKEMIRRIALTQLDGVRQKFNELRGEKDENVPKKTISQTKKVGFGPEKDMETEWVPNPEYELYKQCEKAIRDMEDGLNNGTYADFEEAYKALGAGLDAKSKWNQLRDEVTVETEGREGLLALARKYREQKNYALAEEYFGRYFGKQMEGVRKKLTMEEVSQRYRGNVHFGVSVAHRVDAAKEQFDAIQAEHAQWNKEHPDALMPIREWNGRLAWDQMEAAALQEIYGLECQREQNAAYKTDPSAVGDAGEQKAWGEFMNMKGEHGQGEWWEPFAMSDATLDGIIERLPLDIALIAISGGIAGAASRVVSSTILRAGLSVAEREVFAYGVTGGARAIIAPVAGFLTETSLFTLSHSALGAARDGRFSFDSFGGFMGEWWENIKIMGGLGLVGRLAQGIKAGFIAANAMEITGMAAIGGGHMDLHTLGMVAGLKISHAVPAAFSANARLERASKKAENLGTDANEAVRKAMEYRTANGGKSDPKLDEAARAAVEKARNASAEAETILGEIRVEQEHATEKEQAEIEKQRAKETKKAEDAEKIAREKANNERKEKNKKAVEQIQDPTSKEMAKMAMERFPDRPEMVEYFLDQGRPEKAKELQQKGKKEAKQAVADINDHMQNMREWIDMGLADGKLSEAQAKAMREQFFRMAEGTEQAALRREIGDTYRELNGRTDKAQAESHKKVMSDILATESYTEGKLKPDAKARIESELAKIKDPKIREQLENYRKAEEGRRAELEKEINNIPEEYRQDFRKLSDLHDNYRIKMNEFDQVIDPKLEIIFIERTVWGKDGRPTDYVVMDGDVPKLNEKVFKEKMDTAFNELGLDKSERALFDEQQKMIEKSLQQYARENPGKLSPAEMNEYLAKQAEVLLFQMRQSYQCQMGEHGLRHFSSNINVALQDYAGSTIPRGEAGGPHEGLFMKPDGTPYGTGPDYADNRAMAIAEGIPGEVKLMIETGMMNHDLGYATVAGHIYHTSLNHEGFAATDAHPTTSTSILARDPVIRKMFGDNFELLLEVMHSHDQVTTAVDATGIRLSNGQMLYPSKLFRAFQSADNLGTAAFEKLPPIVRNSPAMRALLEHMGLAAPAYDAAKGAVKLPSGYTEKINLHTDYAALRTKIDADVAAGKMTAAEATKLREQLQPMEKFKEYYQKGLEESRNEFEERYKRGEISAAERDNALAALHEYDVCFPDVNKFMTAPTAMTALIYSDIVTMPDGSSNITMHVSPAFRMLVDVMGPKLAVAQMKKPFSDYAERHVSRTVEKMGHKNIHELSQGEYTALAESMGISAEKAVEARKKASAETDPRKIGKILADALVDGYIDSIPFDKLTDNTGSVSASWDTVAGRVNIRVTGIDWEAPGYKEMRDAFAFSEGGKDFSLSEGQMPTTAEGYRSLYGKLSARYESLRSEAAKKGIGAVYRFEQQVETIRSTMTAVEARYTRYLAERSMESRGLDTRIDGVKNGLDLLDGPNFNAAKPALMADLRELARSGSPTAAAMRATLETQTGPMGTKELGALKRQFNSIRTEIIGTETITGTPRTKARAQLTGEEALPGATAP